MKRPDAHAPGRQQPALTPAEAVASTSAAPRPPGVRSTPPSPRAAAQPSPPRSTASHRPTPWSPQPHAAPANEPHASDPHTPPHRSPRRTRRPSQLHPRRTAPSKAPRDPTTAGADAAAEPAIRATSDRILSRSALASRWGRWFRRAVRLPTEHLEVTLGFPAGQDPVVWGTETSMTAEALPLRTAPSRHDDGGTASSPGRRPPPRCTPGTVWSGSSGPGPNQTRTRRS